MDDLEEDFTFNPTHLLYENLSDLEEDDYILPDTSDDLTTDTTLNGYLPLDPEEENALNDPEEENVLNDLPTDIGCDIQESFVRSGNKYKIENDVINNFTTENYTYCDFNESYNNKEEHEKTNSTDNHNHEDESSDENDSDIEMEFEDILSSMIPASVDKDSEINFNDYSSKCEGKQILNTSPQ